jgi:hypothetical protein
MRALPDSARSLNAVLGRMARSSVASDLGAGMHKTMSLRFAGYLTAVARDPS